MTHAEHPNTNVKDAASGPLMTIPELPYQAESLAPAISARTMQYHYGVHTQAYIDNLNRLGATTHDVYSSVEAIICAAPEGPLYNNAAQAWNHVFYFLGLSPEGGGEPTGELAMAIDRDFGSYGRFYDAFVEAGTSVFGSGWVWLVADGGQRLSIQAGTNAYNPMRQGLKPIWVADVWEHAYYLDYQNRRGEALRRLADIIDWDVVARRYIL